MAQTDKPNYPGNFYYKEKVSASTNKPLPSVVQPPVLELKQLPDNLKYVFLAENDNFPVIISTNVLKKHKGAIGRTLSNIKGICPVMCEHKILLEDDAKPVREPKED